MGSVSRFSSSSVSGRVAGAGVAPASLVASRRWAWRSAFVAGGQSVGGCCRVVSLPFRLRCVSCRSSALGSVGWSVRLALSFSLAGVLVLRRPWAWSSSSLCSPCASLWRRFRIKLAGGWVGFGSPALFFGGGLVGRCACDRSRCRFCFPLVPVSPALGAVLVAVARSAGLPSVPSSLRRVSPGRPVSQVSVSRLRRLLGL